MGNVSADGRSLVGKRRRLIANDEVGVSNYEGSAVRAVASQSAGLWAGNKIVDVDEVTREERKGVGRPRGREAIVPVNSVVGKRDMD